MERRRLQIQERKRTVDGMRSLRRREPIASRLQEVEITLDKTECH